MPKPINDELRRYAEQQNTKSRMFVESVVVESEDIKDTYADWNAADSVSGWTVLRDGGARPTGTAGVKVSYATGTADVATALPLMSGATVPVVAIKWQYATADEVFQNFTSFTARLDPNQDGASGVEVTHYVGQLFRVSAVIDGDWELESVTQPIIVEAPATVDDVQFTIPNTTNRALLGDAPENESRAITVVHIAALKGAGVEAGNVAWIGNTAITELTSGTHDIFGYRLLSIGGQEGSQTVHVKQLQVGLGIPRFVMNVGAYTTQTIEFTGANAPALTTAAASTDLVEVVVEDEQRGGSVGTSFIRNNGSTDWVAVEDGQTLDELVGVSTTGPVYEMRYIATPSTDTFSIPTVRRMGVRELTREPLDGIARLGNPTYQLDPFTFQASIPEFQVQLTRDGVKDYRDYATELFSDNHPGQIEFRVHYGDPENMARKDWMHVDTFRLRNIETGSDSVVIDAVHPLALTRRSIPVGSSNGQTAIVYNGTTTTAANVYGLMLDEVGLPARYRGVELGSSATTKIAKTISRPRPAKEELDRVAFVEGGAVIPSGGRLKWKRIFTTTGGYANAPAEFFDNVTPLSVSPNLHRRIVSYRAPYGFSQRLDDGRGGFLGAVLQTSTSALAKLGYAAVDPVQDLDDETAQWLLGDDSTGVGSVYGAAIARRTISSFKAGAPIISFKSDHPRPWLELGDTVEVKTDRFVGRGLETDRALRGRLSVVGTVVGHDMNGTEFAVWVPEIEASLPSPTNMPISYVNPIVKILDERLLTQEAVGTEQRYNIDILLDTDEAAKSYNVQVQYTQVLPPPLSPTFVNYNYNVDVATPGLQERHVILAWGSTSPLSLPIKPSTIGPRPFTQPYISVSPYTRVGGSTGSGITGITQSVAASTPDVTDGVGVRAQLSGTTYTLGAHRIVAGTGINIFWSTASGDLVISTT